MNYFLYSSLEKGTILIIFYFWLGYLADYILGESLLKRILWMRNSNEWTYLASSFSLSFIFLGLDKYKSWIRKAYSVELCFYMCISHYITTLPFGMIILLLCSSFYYLCRTTVVENIALGWPIILLWFFRNFVCRVPCH